VNFSHVAAEGESVGLKALYFGPQHSLQLGTSVRIDEPPPGRGNTADDAQDFQNWASLFYTWEVYKVLIQQKESTDDAYRYPGDNAEALAIADSKLGASVRARMADIEKKLKR
jgi:hypothetical protein